mmetsp:Transcript_33703/g.108435  ORF Transcript_33703/g.108435 Transcript_33703/m.108435 type:complete len:224 (+) Transcript_33703:2468-3139(+)
MQFGVYLSMELRDGGGGCGGQQRRKRVGIRSLRRGHPILRPNRLDKQLWLEPWQRARRRHRVLVDGCIVLLRLPCALRQAGGLILKTPPLWRPVGRRRRRAPHQLGREPQPRHLCAVARVSGGGGGGLLLRDGARPRLRRPQPAEPAVVCGLEEGALLGDVVAQLLRVEGAQGGAEQERRLLGQLCAHRGRGSLVNRLLVEGVLRLREHEVAEGGEHLEAQVG